MVGTNTIGAMAARSAAAAARLALSVTTSLETANGAVYAASEVINLTIGKDANVVSVA